MFPQIYSNHLLKVGDISILQNMNNLSNKHK